MNIPEYLTLEELVRFYPDELPEHLVWKLDNLISEKESLEYENYEEQYNELVSAIESLLLDNVCSVDELKQRLRNLI